MKKILSIILLIAMLVSTASVAFADGAFSVQKPNKIIVGISADFPPFECYENNELTGFDIDLMKYIGERAELDVEFVNMSFDALLTAVLNGEVDCAISAISYTEERKKHFDYSIPYLSAKVMYDDEESIEQYGIVFPGDSDEKAKVLEASGNADFSLYKRVNDVLSELIEDKTIEKLCEKYNFIKSSDGASFDYQYAVIPVDGELQESENDLSEETSSGSSLAPPNKWALEYVEKADSLGITQNEKIYRYTMSITREEFCELVYNLYTNVMGETDFDVDDKFNDTDNADVLFLNSMGIINGKSEAIFAPNDFLTREEAATIIVRLINKLSPMPVSEMWFEYDDIADISDWASDSVQIISNLGFMNGVGDNKFAPKDNFTTEQAIATLVRVYDGLESVQDEPDFADKLNANMPDDKNYMFSPISIKMAFALAANGASGDTKTEILYALNISDLDKFNELSKDLIERYSQTEILKLNIANSVWMNKDKTSQNFSDNYKAIVTEFYDADVKTVDNLNAVEEVNSWVNDKTNGKISKIVESPDDFWAMLVNAIYFKGLWQNEFNESATKPDEFTNADGTKATADFMNKTMWSAYADTKSAKIIELPYKNRVDMVSETGEFIGRHIYDNLDVSMYLILPEDDIEVERELSKAINEDFFKTEYIKLAMPKFKIEYQTGLNDMLKDIGIVSAFDENTADFKNMFDNGNMHISSTLHKTYISVDEKGTEAAAVTAIHMAGSALPPKPIELKFNKPFYFAIKDKTSGETLFMGRYAFAD